MKKALYILGDLEDRDLVWLNQAGRVRALDPGEALITAGRAVDDLFFIVAGEFDVVLPGGRSVARLSTGDIAGEMSFVEKRTPTASVVAADRAEVLAVPRAAIEARFEVDTGFAARFYRALAVFLSDRLRTATSGAADGDAEEIDEGLLDTLHVAGDRFTRLLDLLAGRAR